MNNNFRTYTKYSWMGIFLMLTVLLSISIRYLIPGSYRIWEDETISLPGGIFEIDIHQETKEVQSQKTPLTENLQVSHKDTKGTVKLFGLIPIKEVSVEIWEHMELIPCGDIIGIDISTDGIMILGTGQIQTHEGLQESPAKGIIYTGDLIQEIDGKKMSSMDDVTEYLEKLEDEPVEMIVKREGVLVEVEVQPIEDIHKEYRLGIWLRDREQGLGTLTYINPENGDFGAVGHGITDVDTREILSVGSGMITTASIVRIVPGVGGQAGEIQGSIGSENLGSIHNNTKNGIYGMITDTNYMDRDAYPIALKDELKEGYATVLCSLDSEGPKEYSVEIHKNDSILSSTSSFIVEITDKRLLDMTGGIIQGMSGSPIIQDGKLVGAVTHVLVNDPTRGYGIFIENMLEAAG